MIFYQTKGFNVPPYSFFRNMLYGLLIIAGLIRPVRAQKVQTSKKTLDFALTLPVFYDVDERDAEATLKVLGDLLVRQKQITYTNKNVYIFKSTAELLSLVNV